MDVSTKRRRCDSEQSVPSEMEPDVRRSLGVVKTIGINQVRSLACIL